MNKLCQAGLFDIDNKLKKGIYPELKIIPKIKILKTWVLSWNIFNICKLFIKKFELAALTPAKGRTCTKVSLVIANKR